MSPTPQRRPASFFLWAGAAQAAAVFAGFGLNLVTEAQPILPITALVIAHGTFAAGWYVLFLVQAALVGRGSMRLHMRLGEASVAVAAGILLTGPMIMVMGYRRSLSMGEDQSFIVAFNLITLISFALLYARGWLHRGDAPAHKRFMLCAGLAMIGPAFGRLAAVLGVPPALGLIFIIGLLAALVRHDRATLDGAHAATKFSAAVVLGGILVGLAVGPSTAWSALVRSWLG